MADNLEAAIREYFERARGESFPDGVYDDSEGFTPLPSEVCPMCPGLMADERCTNDLLYTHCCTAKHIALKYGLNVELFEDAIARTLGMPSYTEQTLGALDSQLKEQGDI